MKGIYVISRGQDALIPAFIAGDVGRFVFVICQRIAELVMRKVVEKDRPFLALAQLEFKCYLTPEDEAEIRAHGVKKWLDKNQDRLETEGVE